MENLVFEGFKFMMLGMGTVFAFLTLMILAMNLQSYIIHKFFPEPVATTPNSKPSSNPVKNSSNTKVAAISAAITHHKNVKS